jgi:predicted acylesterase/phospholipase RssA
MSKILKLGFAMGGGVSLGSFSGSALTESIKLALLFGKDRNGEAYGAIEIDVFVGASAGAMSLGVMLKALAFPSKEDNKRIQAKKRLQELYHLNESDFSSFSVQKREQLIDAQLAQDLMDDIWTKQISIDTLLNKEGNEKIPPLKFQAGIFNRKAIVDIAARNLLPTNNEDYNANDLATYSLLSNRVLFGCSIANLNPLHAKAVDLFPVAPHSGIATNDALTSKLHKEIRVFDINFKEVTTDKLDNTDIHPTRWVRFNWCDAVKKQSFSTKSGNDWKHIISTAIASGSFPFAFEAVTLQRYRWEYPSGLWPYDTNSNSFTYIDGGVFNNEPVAEAFKLASHIDALSKDDNYERRILFVDPNVGGKPSLNLPGLSEFSNQDPISAFGSIIKGLDGNDLITKTSLDKLIGQGLSQFIASSEQAESKEEHRTFQIANKLVLRNRFREALKYRLPPENECFNTLKVEIRQQLQELSHKDSIPTLPSNLGAEIERLANEPGSVVTSLKGLGADINNAELIDEFNETIQLQIMTALLYSYIDIICGLSAKSRDSQLIAIGPFDQDGKSIFLPGSPIAAFSGFMSDIPSRYESKVARFCTFEFMRKSGLLGNESNLYDTPERFDQNHPNYKAYMNDFKAGMHEVAERVEEMIESSHLLDLGYLNGPALGFIAGRLKSMIQDIDYKIGASYSIELRVTVSDKDFELDGKEWADNDRHPIRLKRYGNQLCLVSFASWDEVNEKWSGYNVEDGQLFIDRDGWAGINDKVFVKIKLPSKESVQAAKQIGYPIFWSKQTLAKNGEYSDVELSNFWNLKNGLVPFASLF